MKTKVVDGPLPPVSSTKPRVRRNVSWNLITGAVNTVALLLLYPLALGAVSAEPYAVWILIYTFVQFSSLFDLGLGTGLTKRLNLGASSGSSRQEIARTQVAGKHIFRYLGIILGALAILCTSLFLRNNVEHIGFDGAMYIAAACVGVTVYFGLQSRAANSILWSFDRSDLERKSALAGIAVRIILTIAVFFGIPEQPATWILLVIAECLGLLTTSTLTVFLSWKYQYRYQGPKEDLRRSERELARESLPFFFSSAAGALALQIPILCVGLFLSLQQVAEFTAIQRILQAARLGISSVVNPFTKQVIASRDTEALLAPVRWRLAFTAVAPVSIGTAALLLFGEYLLRIWIGDANAPDLLAAALVFASFPFLAIKTTSSLVIAQSTRPWHLTASEGLSIALLASSLLVGRSMETLVPVALIIAIATIASAIYNEVALRTWRSDISLVFIYLSSAALTTFCLVLVTGLKELTIQIRIAVLIAVCLAHTVAFISLRRMGSKIA